MNHKWDKNNTCINCGITREKKSWRRLMAITNHPPYDHYVYGKSWAYFFEPKIGTFKRPDCKTSQPNL